MKNHFYDHAAAPGACDGDFAHCVASGMGCCSQHHELLCAACKAAFAAPFHVQRCVDDLAQLLKASDDG